MAAQVDSSDFRAGRPTTWAVLLALPIIGLAFLLAQPDFDVHWEHHPSHFWLVLLTAAVNVVLAYITNIAAGRYRDARLVLVSLAFLASSGFLGLHALATPGVLLAAPNAGFVIATPIGLLLAAVFAAASVSPVGGPRAGLVLRYRNVLLGALFALMAVWAFLSLARLPPLDGPPPSGEGAGPVTVIATVGVALYAFAAWRYVRLYRDRGGIVPLTVAVAFVLLAEAMIAIALSRNWHASWWEWHVLMLLAFAAIALGARSEYRRSGSLSAAFGGLYLEATLNRVNRWHAGAIASVAAAEQRGESPDRILAKLRREGATSDELDLLLGASRELRRLDDAFRPYLPSVVAPGFGSRADVGRLGGIERDISVLFADLAAFTSFSETHAPTEVLAMLNDYWATVVPVIDEAGGVIEQFAGDGVMAIFNADGTQPDHARRAARGALAIVEAGRPLASAHADWPVFRVGVNTGPAVVGNVGAAGRISFAAIGDTTNVAARLMSAGEPSEVVIAEATWNALGDVRDGVPLGPTILKGKREPVEAWVLRGFS